MSEEANGSGSEEAAEKPRGPFGGLTPAEAAKKGWEKRRERLAQGADTARRSRTPLDALRELLVDDPDRYARGVAAMMEKGDPRALGMLERLFAEAAPTSTASTVAEIEAMDADQLRRYIAQLEAERLAHDLPAPAEPAAHAPSGAEHLATD